jgi:Tfp pilus assembly protein PilF
MSRCIGLLFLLMCAVSAAQAQGSRAQSAASYVERGNGWLNKGELERAIDNYSLAIVFDGGHAGAYYNRGLARLRKDDLDGALEDFDRSLELSPRLALDPPRSRAGALTQIERREVMQCRFTKMSEG